MINQTWSPMFDMINIFEVFLPQLLRYPNPNDPLNGEAAALLIKHPKDYELKVKGEWKHIYSVLGLIGVDYVNRYATKEAAEASTSGGKGEGGEEEEEEIEMSDVGSLSDEEH